MASKAGDGIVETIKTVFWALVIAGIFRTLLFQPFWIPSGSMKDTLLIGDFLFVNKMAYGYSRYSCPFSACPITGRLFGSEPERGDVIVFRHPTTGQDYIKRVIGLPGDTVQMKDGKLYLNGAAVQTDPAGFFEEIYAPQGPEGRRPICSNDPVGLGGVCQKEKFIETLPGGRAHSVLNARNDNRLVFLHGRQPRQQPGQPGTGSWRRRRVPAAGIPDRTRRPDHVLVGRQVAVLLLDMARRPVLQGGRVTGVRAPRQGSVG